MAVIAPESRRDRLVVADEAGLRRLSFPSAIAGTLAAYGAFAVLAAVVSGILDATNTDVDITERDWETAGSVGAVIVGAALFVSYLFGGYVAGRMARRAGLMHGVAVFVLGVAAAALIGLGIDQMADTDALAEDLRSVGIPTDADEWGSVATVAGIISLVAILAGSLLGATLGDRWHSKLMARAADPEVGRTAERHREAAERALEREKERDAEREAEIDLRDKPEPETFDRTTGAGPDATQRDREPGVVTSDRS